MGESGLLNLNRMADFWQGRPLDQIINMHAERMKKTEGNTIAGCFFLLQHFFLYFRYHITHLKKTQIENIYSILTVFQCHSSSFINVDTDIEDTMCPVHYPLPL